MAHSPESTREGVEIIDYWGIHGAPYGDTIRRMNDLDPTFTKAVQRLGALLVENEYEPTPGFRNEQVPPFDVYEQYGFETAGHGLWFAVDQRVKELTEGAAYLGEVQKPELFERTETPRPLLVALQGEAAQQNPEDFPDYAVAISKIEDPRANIPVRLKFRK
jgi:hypothetical protein